jgi:hypothetical protein
LLERFRMYLHLRQVLWERYQESNSLSDPDVLAASRQLDNVVVPMMRDRVATCACDTVCPGSGLHAGVGDRFRNDMSGV